MFDDLKDARNVKMDDLEQYLELVLKMYELSPEGVPEGTRARVCLLVMSIHAFVGVIKGNRCTHTHTHT